MDGKCYCCGKAGHKSPQCEFKDKPKNEWAINKKEQSHAQAGKSETETFDPSSSKKSNTNQEKTDHQKKHEWNGVHYQLYQSRNIKEWILLDNESTVTIFCNPNLVEGIHETDESLDLVTNAGVLRTNLKANIPGWGKAWFSPHAITNIFSYAEMAKRH